MKAFFAMVCCGLLLACTSTSSPTSSTEAPFPPALSIDSRGGPPMIVKAGTAELASVACGAGAIVTLGDPGVPPLPWDLSVVRASDGTVLLTGTITDLPKWLVFFGEDGGISSVPVAGPPGPTCPATSSPTPTTTLSPSANIPPTPSASFALDCGPLAAGSCALAVAAAGIMLPAGHRPVLAVRIDLPTTLMTCPPSGGPVGSRVCQLLVHITTGAGDTTVALVGTPDGWMPSALMK